jgi:acetyltransferase-like isoleucine patch superfamily enzyme
MNGNRKLSWDWYPGVIPDNVTVGSEAYIESTYSFQLCTSRQPEAIRIGRAASLYLGVMFDLGPNATVAIGPFSLLHGTRFIVDQTVTVGSHCLFSWNTVLMDTRRVPQDPVERRAALTAAAHSPVRRLQTNAPTHPIRVGDGVWIGFDSIILPGVTIGDGAIIGARSVVTESVPAFAIAAGNPARVVRQLDPVESRQAMAAALRDRPFALT